MILYRSIHLYLTVNLCIFHKIDVGFLNIRKHWRNTEIVKFVNIFRPAFNVIPLVLDNIDHIAMRYRIPK